MNIIIAGQKLSAHPIYLSFSATVRICFRAGFKTKYALKCVNFIETS